MTGEGVDTLLVQRLAEAAGLALAPAEAQALSSRLAAMLAAAERFDTLGLDWVEPAITVPVDGR